MSAIKITLPEGTNVCNGKQITFKAPCDCEGVTGIVIGDTTYELVDAIGSPVAEESFCGDAMVSVLLDTNSKKAYIQNAALSLPNFVRLCNTLGIEGIDSILEVEGVDTHSDLIHRHELYIPLEVGENEIELPCKFTPKLSGTVYCSYVVSDSSAVDNDVLSVYSNGKLVASNPADTYIGVVVPISAGDNITFKFNCSVTGDVKLQRIQIYGDISYKASYLLGIDN